MERLQSVIIVVIDSLGAGELPDAAKYGDVGSNTLGNTARIIGGLNMPNLGKLGLGNIIDVEGVPPVEAPLAAFGKMAEVAAGKDTTTGHWEIAGLVLDNPFPVFSEGFPASVINEFELKIGRKTLGNVVASGTEIIERLGEEHIKTGCPIVYTSADSVFQIAAHEDIIPIDEQYRMCRTARAILTGQNAVGRVIARPFVGSPGAFKRTPNRHDFSLEPVGPTVLDLLKDRGLAVLAVGKINDIFAGCGITESVHTKSNAEGINVTIDCIRKNKKGLVFTNLVDLDSSFGHRNDPRGYGTALEEIDQWVPRLLAEITEDKLLIITADHGCDPTTASTDHSREYVPLLVYSPKTKIGVNLGVRQTFGDIAATISEIFALNFKCGTSFLKDLGITSS